MKKQKSIALYAFGKHIQGLATKVNGITGAMSFEDFSKIANDIRTSFFMMESLCKIYRKTYGEKPFTKWLEKTKKVEDILGQIDFYNNEILPNLTDDKEKGPIKEKLLQIYKDTLSILDEDGWLTGERGRKIEEKLTTLVFRKEKEEIERFLQNAISKIIDFHHSVTYKDIENEVHELRRKIRWISIYSQALNGLIQLKKVESGQDEVYKKYLTEEVVTSKYNKLPACMDDTKCIYLNQNVFYALSWLISELGKIKDEGLLLLYRNEKSEKLEQLSQRAKDICTDFFEKDEILQKLIVE